NPTLRLAPGGGVADTVVYLVDIQSGRSYVGNEIDSAYGRSVFALGASLERGSCGLVPYVQLAAPMGSSLVVSSPIGSCPLRGVMHEGPDAGDIFHVALEGRGGQARADLFVPGPIDVTCDPDGGAGDAWVFVQRHPYHVITGDDGGFRMAEVPPGVYRIAAWHAPVLVGFGADGKPRMGPPVMAQGTVTVRADHVSTIDLTLP
ncbi:MAG TPA: carboxypeptidase-like regulatory domain-containing protein, partial [Kofleriaceae bacterium]|nr:carboxypeptidase-like regulatory domain-containing protein [Kofleriaceae bacterium]